MILRTSLVALALIAAPTFAGGVAVAQTPAASTTASPAAPTPAVKRTHEKKAKAATTMTAPAAAPAMAVSKTNTIAPAPTPANPVATASTTAKVAKAKSDKPRSAAQLASAGRMKACGAQWQGMKSAGTTAGKTWRQFSAECLKKPA